MQQGRLLVLHPMGRGVWVPAFAGTTRGQASRSRGAISPELCKFVAPPRTEGAGNAGCALHPRSRVQKSAIEAHTSIQGSGDIRLPLRNGFTAYPRSPRRRIRLVTVTGGLKVLPARSGPHRLRRLGASNGRQDHTASPYATQASFVLVAPENRSRGSSRPAILSAPDAPRPPHPATNVCDDHDTPLDRHGTGEVVILIYRIVKRNIFDFGA